MLGFDQHLTKQKITREHFRVFHSIGCKLQNKSHGFLTSKFKHKVIFLSLHWVYSWAHAIQSNKWKTSFFWLFCLFYFQKVSHFSLEPWSRQTLANHSMPQKQDFKLLVTDSQQLQFLAIGWAASVRQNVFLSSTQQMFNHLTNKARLLNYPAKTLIYIVAG